MVAALERSAFLERLTKLPGFGKWTAYQVFCDYGEVLAAADRERGRAPKSLVSGGGGGNGVGARYLARLVYAGPGTVEAIKSLEATDVLRNVDEDNYMRGNHQAALCQGV